MRIRLLPAWVMAGLYLWAAADCPARIIRIPAEYTDIAAGIRAAANGDTVEVAPGEYFENLNLRGKNIVLTSRWYLERDTSLIRSTIINGSRPQHPDTASCVIFSSGEGNGCILQGFTLTGGSGTKWKDIHNNLTYREGGGILIERSSPVIRFNMILYNKATNATGCESAGGGGIRIGDGNPKILNNIIAYNQGKYGAGIVLNYTGVTIRNNLIAFNSGSSQYYGGSGIWSYNVHGTDPRLIENNTIAGNVATTGTGGVLAWSCSLTLRNNIIWGNKPALRQTQTADGGTVTASWCNVQNGIAGTGNLNTDPMTGDQSFLLLEGSPCIDAGDTSAVLNDRTDPHDPDKAMHPSKGGKRNDIGAYGGPGAGITGFLQSSASGVPVTFLPLGEIKIKTYPNPATDNMLISYRLDASSEVGLRITDLTGRTVNLHQAGPLPAGIHEYWLDVSGLSPGHYICSLETRSGTGACRMTVAR